MTKDNELFTSMPVGRAVAKLAIPTVVSQIIVILYSLADTFFIGQIGDPNQIAALSITFPIYTLLTAVANLFGIGANSILPVLGICHWRHSHSWRPLPGPLGSLCRQNKRSGHWFDHWRHHEYHS